ncbi:MAG: sodium-dependent transporter [Rhodospirillales bacterium]|nr:sodium-dependent transporter [Rhodospirillaceae bacterium]MDP6426516.1 sodium-dependent transporter [Rhodospirillales bacterium]MDP6645225.1 sodium-dependent transporter [Rhodospirillales bacterium]MDP6840404.1 sodium-dependent transporter [Rhodospirillales bacterium]
MAEAVVGAKRQAHQTWSNWPTFIMAVAGSAVGLGNIWKFPYITGENGGGAFVIVYLICIAAIGLPVMMTEIMLGRRGRLSPVNSMIELAKESNRTQRWGLLGVMMMFAAFLILSFYSVIAGWAIPYIGHSITGTFNGASPDQVGGIFGGLLASPGKLLLWHTVFMVLTVGVSASGVKAGIERAVTILMPALFVLLAGLIVYNLVVDTASFGKALGFLFNPDFSKLTAEAILTAIGHAFFTLSIAGGAVFAYGSYLDSGSSIATTSFAVAIVDTLVALMAGMAIFPIVFANGLEPGAGPGLVFVTLPIAFGKMPGGQIVGLLFFVMLVIAAWTSSISMLEAIVEWLQERGMGRAKASASVAGGAWLLGLTTVLSLNEWKGFHPLGFIGRFEGKTLFDLYDFLTANIMLPLGALLMAVFAGWIMTQNDTEDELAMTSGYGLWRLLIRYVAPIGIGVIFVANLG